MWCAQHLDPLSPLSSVLTRLEQSGAIEGAEKFRFFFFFRMSVSES